MNILLLGNGFDLHHHLPTKYINFLNTVDYLANHTLYDVETVGDIFRSSQLQKIDNGIAQSYERYKTAYNKTPLEWNVIEKLSSLAQNNIWFVYLFKTFNKDIGWIDFEKEISTAVQYFEELLHETNTTLIAENAVSSREGQYIVRQFSFLWDSDANTTNSLSKRLWQIDSSYSIEYPLGSRNRIINKKKIINTLSDALYELAEGLKIYLHCFVDAVVEVVKQEKTFELCQALLYSDYAITLNYTNTYEIFYGNSNTFHLHGNVSNEIVLGVNPDNSDKIGTVDTSFIKFKKYYQRAMFQTDAAYLRWIKEHENTAEDKNLVVMGHSLDITDKDIVIELFEIATDITILFYNKDAKSDYIANLVNIFGMDKFLWLRKKKNLTFLSLDIDFSEFAYMRAGNQFLEEYLCNVS